MLCAVIGACVFAKMRTPDVNASHQAKAQNAPAALETRMQNVMYHFSDRISVHIISLSGKLVPAAGHSVPAFDDANSFVLELAAARIDVPADSLAGALNEHVFASSDAALKSIRVQTDGQFLKISGKLHSKGDLPFEAKGQVSLTAEGEIRLHVEKVKAAHIPATKMMDLLGVKVADLIHTKSLQGIRAEEDDLILDPEKVFPPPQIRGKLSAIRNEGQMIVLEYGGGAAKSGSRETGNFMSYKGAGPLKFGKLTMEPTDLTLIDMNPADPFDFYLEHYKEELAAGYSKTTPTFGLRVFMRDFNKLAPAARGGI